MKKKISLIILCGIILLGVCGCGNKDNNEYNFIKELKCDALNNVKYSFKNYFLTNDNDLYLLNTEQLYSNDENCKKLNNQIKIMKLIVGKIGFVLDSNNNIYQIENGELKTVPCSDDCSLGTIIPNDLKSLKDNSIINQKDCYVLKNDGKLYWYEEVYTDNNKMELVLFKEYINEIILEYDISWDGHIGYIKTDKAFYISTITNEEQCKKYADVKCEYEFVKNDELTSIYDNISIYSYSEHSYITKDGKQYQLKN